MKTKSAVWVVVVLVIVSALFIKIGLSKSDADKKTPKDKVQKKVTAYIVTPTRLTDELSVSGSLLPDEEVELRNEVSGRVVMLHLPEGEFVHKGTLLVKLFDEDLQASLKKLQVQLAVKQQIYNRQAELLKVNGVSRNDYDQTGLELKTIQADIDALKASIRKTEVKAPFDGTIGLRQISEGAVLQASSVLATIRSTAKIKLDFSVPEKYSAKIRAGVHIVFTLSANASKEYKATVYATEMGVESATRNMKVRARVDSYSADLISGAFANVRLKMGENDHAIMVPTSALIPEEDTNTLIVARKGKAHFSEVKTGVRNASTVEITEGIEPGDTVILNGIQFLKENAKLSYSSVKTTL